MAGGVELIAAYGAGALRGAIIAVYGELRSRGQLSPRLPPLACGARSGRRRGEARRGPRAARPIGARRDRGSRGPGRAGARAARALLARLAAAADPWPGELDRLRCPAATAPRSTNARVRRLQRGPRPVPRGPASTAAAERVRDAAGPPAARYGGRYAQRKREARGSTSRTSSCWPATCCATELRERYRERFST